MIIKFEAAMRYFELQLMLILRRLIVFLLHTSVSPNAMANQNAECLRKRITSILRHAIMTNQIYREKAHRKSGAHCHVIGARRRPQSVSINGRPGVVVD